MQPQIDIIIEDELVTTRILIESGSTSPRTKIYVRKRQDSHMVCKIILLVTHCPQCIGAGCC